MNIFVLSKDPKKAAQYHCDKHVVKMVLETAQLLSTACHELGIESPTLYKATHKNHPCSIWTRKSKANFVWLCKLGIELSKEYTFRYGKQHKSLAVIKEAKSYIDLLNFSKEVMTKPALAMPDDYKEKSPIKSYRKYYINDKGDLLSYTRREIPDWMK